MGDLLICLFDIAPTQNSVILSERSESKDLRLSLLLQLQFG
jgi:hypothetical protein